MAFTAEYLTCLGGGGNLIRHCDRRGKKTSKIALYINPLWLIPARTKEYVLCSAWWLIHFSRLLSSVLSLRVCISLPLSVSLSTFPGKYFMPEQSASAYLHPYPIALLMASGPQALNFSGDGPHQGLLRFTPMHLGTRVSTAGRSKHLRTETTRRETSHNFQLSPKPWISCWYSNTLFILLEMYTTVRTKDRWQTCVCSQSHYTQPRQTPALVTLYICCLAADICCPAVAERSCQSASHLLPVALAQHQPSCDSARLNGKKNACGGKGRGE